MFVSISVSVRLCPCPCLSVRPSVRLSLSASASVSVSVSLSVWLFVSVCPAVCLSGLSVCLLASRSFLDWISAFMFRVSLASSGVLLRLGRNVLVFLPFPHCFFGLARTAREASSKGPLTSPTINPDNGDSMCPMGQDDCAPFNIEVGVLLDKLLVRCLFLIG